MPDPHSPPKKSSDNAPSPHLAEHMRGLGLESVAAYRRWCRDHGLSARLDKTGFELSRDREHVRLQAMRLGAEGRRRIRDPMRALQLALAGAFDPLSVEDAELRAACDAVARLGAQRPHRGELWGLLRVVHERADFLFASETVAGRQLPFLTGLVGLNERRGQWLRPLADWRPASHNSRKQFASLARHLLAKYPVPGFLDAAWLRRDRGSHAHRDLFVHIGRGGNPRTAATPVPMTKKIAHHFLQAPDRYTIEGAFRWGQVHALGGGPRLCDAVVATPLGSGFAHDTFWQTVLAFFVENPMLDLAQVGPLVDFIDHLKFTPTDVVLPDGRVAQEPPQQPGFSMSRRTPEALLRQMERWHTGLGRGTAAGPDVWPACGIGELRWETGVKNKRVWTLRELRSRQALQMEGRAMRHCVASYLRSCAAGRCSIWSMEVTTSEGTEKRLTIEVSRQRTIVQCRGSRNRLPEQQEIDLLHRWAEQERLGLAAHT